MREILRAWAVQKEGRVGLEVDFAKMVKDMYLPVAKVKVLQCLTLCLSFTLLYLFSPLRFFVLRPLRDIECLR